MEPKFKLAVAIAAAILLGWFFRYELVPTHADTVAVYKLDRFTGDVYLIGGAKQMEVKPKAPE